LRGWWIWLRPAISASVGTRRPRSAASLGYAGGGTPSRNSRIDAAITRVIGSSSTGAPLEIQLSIRSRTNAGAPGSVASEARTIRGGIRPNTHAGSMRLSDVTARHPCSARFTASQPPNDTPTRCARSSPRPARVAASHAAWSSPSRISRSCTLSPASPRTSIAWTVRCAAQAGRFGADIAVLPERPGRSTSGVRGSLPKWWT
jgi:hypothetical protein